MVDLLRLMKAQKRLAAAAGAGIPAHWNRFAIRVTVTGDSQSVALEGPELASLSDDAFEPLREIQRIQEDAGFTLNGFVYEFTKDANGSWHGVGEFDYA